MHKCLTFNSRCSPVIRERFIGAVSDDKGFASFHSELNFCVIFGILALNKLYFCNYK